LTGLISQWQATPMNLQEFRDAVLSDQPPTELNFALSGLWWDAKGDWTIELTNQRSKTRARRVPGYMRTYIARKAIRRMLRTGIIVPVSLRAAFAPGRVGWNRVAMLR